MGRYTDIFYVEDDTDFAYIVESAVNEVKAELSIQISMNGKDALSLLDQLCVERLQPKLILLDLNLPGISGIDILKKIRAMPFLRYVPVLLFSTSESSKDVKAALESGANAYVFKPSGYTNLVACLQSIHDFWLFQNARPN